MDNKQNKIPSGRPPQARRVPPAGQTAKAQSGAPVRRTLTPEQMAEIAREQREKQNAARKNKLEYILSLTIIFLVAFIILAVIFAIFFFSSLTAHEKPDTSTYKMELSDYDNDLTVEVGSIVSGGERYYNFSQMADFFGFAMIGSIDNMKYVVKGSANETVSIYPELDYAHVNEVFVRTEGKSFYKNGNLYVNESFIRDNVRGLEIGTSSKNKTVTISRILLNAVDANGKITDGKKPYYEDISFALKAPEITVAIAESDSAVTVPTVEFVSNLDAYEEFMNPGTTTEFLTLVNPEHVLDENYVPVGLVRLSYGEGLLMKDYAANAFEAMMIEARACGITGLTATKAYVSYSDTLVKFNEVVDEYVNLLGREQARRYAASTVASPGTDEHQSGLAVNLGLTSGIALEDSTAYSWLKENSEKFGFILRYPDGKSGILEAKPDPTQFRYVGRYHAVRINDLEMTLDEYCKYLGL